METRTLKHTDLTVSRACFGTMTFGSQVDEATAARIVDLCIDHGVNFFDTANVYNKGLAETIAGKALKGRRQKIILASKVRGKMGEAADESGLSKRAMLRAIDESLQRLQTDYLDLYYLHQPDYAVAIDETLEAMEQLVRQGKVRYPASSNYSGWQVCRMQWLAEKNSYKPAWITQPMYNLLARGIEQEYLPMTREFGAPIAGTRFDNNQMYLNRYWYDAYFDAVEEILAIARAAGRSPVSFALNWLLHHTTIDCVILGASRIEQLEENLKAMDDGALPASAVAACDAVWAKLRGVTPQYNR
jgi:aryl-alcohol dehydrogenase-like predicted oxidoreductase